MSDLKIEVQKREATGKNANRRLRAAGQVPAVVYGGGLDPVPIQLDAKTVVDLLNRGGENAVFLLELAGTGKSRHVMTRDLAVDPISHQVEHIDFQRVDMKEKVRVQVPVELVGIAEGVKNEGGVLDFMQREVEVECLPGDIPAHIDLDVTELHIGQHLEVGDLVLPAGLELVEEPDRVLVALAHSRVAAAVEEVEAEPEEELLEAEKDEPVVIGRGKEAEEGEETPAGD